MPRSPCCWRRRSRVQVVRDRGWAPYEPPNAGAVAAVGPRSRAAGARLRHLVADVYWMRAVVYFGGKRRAEHARRQELRPAVSAARPRDVARSAFQGGLPLRRDLPGRAPTRRAGPAGSGDRAAGDAASSAIRRAGSTCTTSASSTTGGCSDYEQRGRVVRARGERAGRADLAGAAAATTLARGRRPRVGAPAVAAAAATAPTIDWLRSNAELPAAAARRDGRDRRAQRRRASASARANGRPPRDWQELVAAGVLRGIPLDPTGVPFVLDADDRARRRLARSRRSGRCRRSRDARPDDDAVAARRSRRCSASASAAFSTSCIYRLPRGSRSSSPPSRCRECGYSLRWYRQHPGPQLAAAARPLPQVRRRRLDRSTRSSSWSPARCSCWSSG